MRALLVLVACAAVCYGGPAIGRLGFYHDDWTSLSVLHFASGGFSSRVAALIHGVPALILRPTIAPIYALGYGLFGLNPLGWQLSLLAANVALAYALYALIVRFGVPRRLALVAAAFYLAYPSKDATMFWPGAIVCSISLAVFLASYLSALEHVRSGSNARRVAAAALLVLSLTTYELALFLIPIFLLAPVSSDETAAARKRRVFIDAAVIGVLLLFYKVVIAPRLQPNGASKTLQLSPFHFAWVYAAAVNAAAGPKLIGYVVLAAWKSLISMPWFAAAGAGICALLSRAEPGEKPADGGNRRVLLLLGAAIAVLGCLPMALSDYTPTPINHQNRLNQVFLLGPALMLAAHLARERSRKSELAALGVVGVFLTAHAGFASTWAESYRRQLALRGELLAGLHDWPREGLLLVLLPERYIERKAPVFDAHWDVSGAIQIWTGDPERHAVTVRPGAVTACSAKALTVNGTEYRPDATRLLDARDGSLRVPAPSDCAVLLSPP